MRSAIVDVAVVVCEVKMGVFVVSNESKIRSNAAALHETYHPQPSIHDSLKQSHNHPTAQYPKTKF
jgi:hypothetical protein